MTLNMADSSLNISITNVTKTYGDFHALKDVSLEVTSGEFITLLGPSGSGKTTLLMVLAGFTSPDYGSVKFGEEEVILKPPHLRGIGMVFQNYALFPHMNVAENVGYPQKLRGVSKDETRATVENALATVKLDGLGHVEGRHDVCTEHDVDPGGGMPLDKSIRAHWVQPIESRRLDPRRCRRVGRRCSTRRQATCTTTTP